jgi:hypothetical protein
VPQKKLYQALSIVPWVYALIWYLATSMGGPRLAELANWGWLLIVAFLVWGFFRVRAQERRNPPPP